MKEGALNLDFGAAGWQIDKRRWDDVQHGGIQSTFKSIAMDSRKAGKKCVGLMEMVSCCGSQLRILCTGNPTQAFLDPIKTMVRMHLGFFLPQKMMLRRCATVSRGHFRPDYKGPKCIWVLRASHMRRIFRGPRPRDLNRRRHGGGGHTDWVGKPKVEEVQLFIWDVLGCPYQALATPQLRKRPLHLWCSHKFMSVQCVTQWSSHEKPTKHYMNLNQTHFPWTSCDRWRSRKWFEKGGRQRSFSAGGYLKTRHYVILCASHNSGTVNAKTTFLPTKWLNYFHIAQFCEDNQIHFGIDDFCASPFSQQHALSSRILMVWFHDSLLANCFWAADILIRDCRKHVFKKTNPIGIEPSCAHTTLILRSISKFPSVSGLLGWTLKQRGVVSVRNCNTCSDKRLALETMPRRKLSFQTWRREVVKFEWNEIIWRGHRRGLMSKRPLHLWCNPQIHVSPMCDAMIVTWKARKA